MKPRKKQKPFLILLGLSQTLSTCSSFIPICYKEKLITKPNPCPISQKPSTKEVLLESSTLMKRSSSLGIHRESILSMSFDDDNEKQEAEHNIIVEETLLKMNLSIDAVSIQIIQEQRTEDNTSNNDNVSEEKIAFQNMLGFIKTFPFAVILPVQPLSLEFHDYDNNNIKEEEEDRDGETKKLETAAGVSLLFLRKKTQEKGSVDGGIKFDISLLEKNVEEEEFNIGGKHQQQMQYIIQLSAVRNSRGQSIPKIFSEKAIITSIVKSINEKANLELGLNIDSVYHKWM